MKRGSLVALVATALVLAGCGGSGASSRTAAGVREDYRAFVSLLAGDEAPRACADYVSVAFKAWLASDKRGSCSSFLESAWTKEHATVSAAMAALETVRVSGDHATIKTAKGNRLMVYSSGRWQESLNYKVVVTDPGGGTFSIARNANGSISRTCHPAGRAGCSPAGTW